jgi:hypothetical protein
MRKLLLLYVTVIALVSAAQNPGARPFDDEAIRDMLEGFAVMEADNEESDPYQRDLPTVADYYRMMEKRCEESGVDKRRILDVAKEEIDRCAAYVKSTGQTSSAHHAVRLLQLVAHSGDRSLLPYLEEKSLDPEIRRSIRSAAAEVYVNIADVEESVNLMRKLYDDRSFRESQYYYVSGLFLQKVKAEEKSLTDEVKRDICTHLLAIVQSADSPGDALDAEFFLRDFLPGYTNSKQRATLVRYANTGNEYMTNNFNPIKAHFDAIPPPKTHRLAQAFPRPAAVAG